MADNQPTTIRAGQLYASIDNPCDECGSELNINTAIMDVDHKGKIIILCPTCFWGDNGE